MNKDDDTTRRTPSNSTHTRARTHTHHTHTHTNTHTNTHTQAQASALAQGQQRFADRLRGRRGAVGAGGASGWLSPSIIIRNVGRNGDTGVLSVGHSLEEKKHACARER